jgi:hypothetical protein
MEINAECWKEYIQNGDLDKAPDFEDALTINWWKNLSLDISSLYSALMQFCELHEWTRQGDSLISFGDLDTNDISVCFNHETNFVEEFSCRLDLRNIDKHFVSNILSLASQLDCMVMDKKGRLFEPTIENIL